MTNKQEVFCDEYVKDFNATQAAVRAGYSLQSAYSIGHENLKKPEIKNKIEERKMEVTKQSNLSLISLILDVAAIKDKCIHEKFDPSNALKACELLSKLLIQNDLKNKEALTKMPLEELEALARSLLNIKS